MGKVFRFGGAALSFTPVGAAAQRRLAVIADGLHAQSRETGSVAQEPDLLPPWPPHNLRCFPPQDQHGPTEGRCQMSDS